MKDAELIRTLLKPCPDCDGRGDHDPGYHGTGGQTCSTCRGSGQVWKDTGKPIFEWTTCRICDGTGSLMHKCTECGGTGNVRKATR